MSRDPIAVSPDEALLEIRDLLRETGFHHLLVVEDGRLAGVISDRDVLRMISPFLDTSTEEQRDVNTLLRKAREIMTPDPVTVRPETSIEAAALLMLEHDISSLPVVGEGGSVEGVVTSKDLLRFRTASAGG